MGCSARVSARFPVLGVATEQGSARLSKRNAGQVNVDASQIKVNASYGSTRLGLAGLDKPGLGWVGRDWSDLHRTGIGLTLHRSGAELGWAGLGWAELGSALGQAGLGWARLRLGWAGLG